MAVRVLIGLNVACFLAMVCSSSLKSLLIPSSLTLINLGASSASETIAAGQFWRLATSCFLHAGFLHLAINMWVLKDIGKETETAYGSLRFCIIYFFSAIGGALTSIFINPLLVSAGASGAIFGSFGAMLAIVWRRPANFEKGYLLLHGKIVIALILYSVIFSFIDKNTDNAAHFGGFLLGFFAGLCALPAQTGATKSYLRIVAPILLLSPIAGAYMVAHELFAHRPDVLAEMDYKRAVQLLNNKQYKAALPLLDATLLKSPKNASARCDRARVYMELKDYDKAISDCNLALEDQAEGKEVLAVRASVYQKNNDYKSAIKDLTRLLKLNPNDSMGYNNRAWSEEAEGLLDDALKDCNESIRLNSNLATTYDTRAVDYILRRKYAEAKQDLDSAIKIKPTDGAFYYHRMIAKKMAGEPYDDDRKEFEKLGYSPESWEPR